MALAVDLLVDTWYTIDMEYQRDEHRVHLILYHLVFCPKRRSLYWSVMSRGMRRS